MQAVILAAGRGNRLSNVYSRPKSLLRLGYLTILEESVACLHRHGIRDIALVVGYRAEDFGLLARRYRLSVVENSFFNKAGSLLSLMSARPLIKDDLLILEGDLLYESKAIRELLDHKASDVTLLSGPSSNGDEVYAYAEGDRIAILTKQLFPNQAHVGEFVGITKVSLHFIKCLFELCAAQRLSRAEYDAVGLMAVSQVIPLRWLLIPGLIWTEIDNTQQLRHAQEVVYPKLKPDRVSAQAILQERRQSDGRRPSQRAPNRSGLAGPDAHSKNDIRLGEVDRPFTVKDREEKLS
jgi:choline kinase